MEEQARPKRVAHVGNIEDRRAVTAECLRDLGSQQLLRSGGVDGGLREARLAIDVYGFRGGRARDGGGAWEE